MPSEKSERHGERYTKLWKEWNTMIWRCNPKNKRHHVWYSDKGIKVCEEWKKYTTFRSWALKNGFQDNLTIDRLDHNKNYCPENCRWITQEENVSDSTLRPVYQYEISSGKLLNTFSSISEASRKSGINKNTITRICNGDLRHSDLYKWEDVKKIGGDNNVLV